MTIQYNKMVFLYSNGIGPGVATPDGFNDLLNSS